MKARSRLAGSKAPRLWASLAIMVLALAPPAAGQKVLKRLDRAASVLRSTLGAADQRIPQDLLDRADCIGVFPSVLKGAFLVGGRYGKGVVVCRTSGNEWSAPANFRIEGGNVGFQIGGNSTDIVLLFIGPKAIDKLLRTKFTIGIDATAAVGPVGRSASGQTDALLGAEILAYSRSRGLFAGVALDGATLRPAHEDNRALYGSTPMITHILQGGMEPPDAAQGLLDALEEHSPRKWPTD